MPKKTSKPQFYTQKEKRELIKTLLLKEPGLSSRMIAKNCFSTHHTVEKIRKELIKNGKITHSDPRPDWMSHPYIRKHPEILETLSERSLSSVRSLGVLDYMMAKNIKSPRYAQTLMNKEARAERLNAGLELSIDDFRLICGDIKDGFPEIEDGSIDIIITDPPYERKAVETGLYDALASFSARVLKDSGILVCMVGTAHLPEVYRRLCSDSRLRYHWQLCVILPRQAPALHWKRISTHHKPVIVLTKGLYKGPLASDLIQASTDKNAGKEFHHWGQDSYVMAELLRRFTSEPNTLVVDPFVGGGSVAEACVQANMKFIGCDIDRQCIKTTQKRIDELLASRATEELNNPQ